MEVLKLKQIFLFAVCLLKYDLVSLSVVVILAKPKVDGKVNDVAVQINEPAELRTKFSAVPKPTVAWLVYSLKSESK